ncbi:MAG: hypothetical protein ACSHX8_00900 [Opitutaceae bacterium]
MNETLNPEFLNDCLEAYIRTFTVKERLQKFIRKSGKVENEQEIFTVVDEMIDRATGYLYDYDSKERIGWNEEFEATHYEFIKQKHKWLSPKGYQRIKAYSSWLCWHDGL